MVNQRLPVDCHVGPTARARLGLGSAGPRLRTLGTAFGLTGLLVACGGKAVIDGTAAGEGGSGGATTTTTTTTTHEGGQGGGPLAITFWNINVSVGCKPGYEPPDPVQVSFTANYANGSSTNVSASIVGAHVTLGAGPSTLDWNFQVSPSTVGPVLGSSSVQVDHSKVEGSGFGGGVPCDFCGSSAEPLLEIDYLIDGQDSLVATGDGLVYCSK
jgi:hypothetical protein